MRLSPRLLKNIWWWEPAYVVDWVAVLSVFFLTALFVVPSKPFERDFDLNDKSISHKYATEQRVPSSLLHFLTFYLPLFLMVLHGAARGSTHHIHHAVLALVSSCSVTHLVSTYLKNHVGRLRPDFVSRCHWDAIMLACAGPEEVIWDGRRSFPSGHSSQAFAGLGVFALYLTGQLHLTRPSQSRDVLSSIALRLLIVFAPIGVAASIALSRIEDYRHHPTDVLAGSFIGSLFAFIAYTVYWTNPILRPLPLSPQSHPNSYELPPPVSTAPSTSTSTPGSSKVQWSDSAKPRLLYRPSSYPSAPHGNTSAPSTSGGAAGSGSSRQRPATSRNQSGTGDDETEVFVIHDAGEEMDREGLNSARKTSGANDTSK